jgi:phage FluMu protein Com
LDLKKIKIERHCEHSEAVCRIIAERFGMRLCSRSLRNEWKIGGHLQGDKLLARANSVGFIRAKLLARANSVGFIRAKLLARANSVGFIHAKLLARANSVGFIHAKLLARANSVGFVHAKLLARANSVGFIRAKLLARANSVGFVRATPAHSRFLTSGRYVNVCNVQIFLREARYKRINTCHSLRNEWQQIFIRSEKNIYENYHTLYKSNLLTKKSNYEHCYYKN